MNNNLQELIDKLVELESQFPNDYNLGEEVRKIIRNLKSK